MWDKQKNAIFKSSGTGRGKRNNDNDKITNDNDNNRDYDIDHNEDGNGTDNFNSFLASKRCEWTACTAAIQLTVLESGKYNKRPYV